MSGSKQQYVNNLRLDSFITSLVQAIPPAPAPGDQAVAFERQKEVLETRLKAEIAIDAKSRSN